MKPNLQCPCCRQQALSLSDKLSMGAGLGRPCRACGKAVAAPHAATQAVVRILVFGAILAAVMFAVHPLLGLAALAILFMAMFAVQVYAVPLIAVDLEQPPRRVETFRCGRGWFWTFAILLAWVFFFGLAGALRTHAASAGQVGGWCVSLALVVAAFVAWDAFLRRYVVTVDETHITTGAFRRTGVPLQDLCALDRPRKAFGSVVLTLRDGRAIRLSSDLMEVERLLAVLRARTGIQRPRW